ncbi:protein kinase [Stieleria sp. TO1_6]|uniref:protein kinase domain-containing protein n=1 Tax=Stieleria tagensis TaxID=2956795 RepID=UPI00209AAD6F|nr:protein kinase [Stieleria tagensis]MCO8123981.1 protein kinase [Stieleria tagensis]
MTQPPPVEYQPGMEVVPGYTLISPLGSGMAGDVWQAQAAGGIKVALKIVRSLSVLGGRKELKALKTIRDVHHPNLCPVFGFWTMDADGRVLADGETEQLTVDSIDAAPPAAGTPAGAIGGTMAISANDPQPIPQQQSTESEKPKISAEQLIVVMGLGDCTLHDRLNAVRAESGLTPDDNVAAGLDAVETIRYLRASASAIDLLNREHQIYHCDIKPQNILLVGGEAQVCDFGLAKRIEGDMRETQQAFATPAYAPPEVLKHEGYSRQGDQYSLAVTYYELRTGLLPFDITSHASMLSAKSTEKLNLDDLQPAERKVMQKALRREPDQRFASCTEFINALALASGVDQRGGITVGRMIAAVALLLVVAGLGVGVWRSIAPESFNEVFFPSEIRIADKLDQARASFQSTEAENFQGSQILLLGIMDQAADVLGKSTGETSQSAETLFADAALRLLDRFHLTLGETESRPGGKLSADDRDKLQNCLTQCQPDQPDPQTAIPSGLQHWAESEAPAMHSKYVRFLALYHAAAIRLALLDGTSSSADHVAALRRLVDDPRLDLGPASGLNSTFATLLPVLATSQPDQFQKWTATHWLQETRLDDLIRAEQRVTKQDDLNQSLPTVYANRWASIREAFILAVEPSITRRDDSADKIGQATMRRVLDQFPDLQLEKQIADLRASAEGQHYDETDRLLQGFDRTQGLSPQQTEMVGIVRLLAEQRNAVDGLDRLQQALDARQIDVAKLNAMRLRDTLSSYLRFVADQAVAKTQRSAVREDDGSQVNAMTQLHAAQAIANAINVAVPAEFFAAAVISGLQSQTDPNQLTELCLALNDDQQFAPLGAAVRVEQQIRSSVPDDFQIRAAAKVLQSPSATLLDKVAASYADFLSACCAALLRQDLGPAGMALRSQPSELIGSLGQERIQIGMNLMVRRAVIESAVTDDNIVDSRYSDSDSGTDSARRAKQYLDLAQFLADQSDVGVTAELSHELFLWSVAANSDQLDTVSLPDALKQQLTSSDSIAQLPNQLLMGLVSVGLQKFQPSDDPKSADTIASQWLIGPATELVNRFGRQQFGPGTGGSRDKNTLIQRVICPTVRQVVAPQMKFDDLNGLPKLVQPTPVDSQELIAFCQSAAPAYSDPLVAAEYQDRELLHRHCMAVGTLAASNSRAEPAERLANRLLVIESALQIDGITGELILRLADSVESVGADQATIGNYRQRAWDRLAMSHSDPDRRSQDLSKAYESTLPAIESLQSESELDQTASKQLYQLLGESAAMGVRYAFTLRSPDAKRTILLASLQRIESALSIYNDRWKDTLRFTLGTAYLTKGNVCEDLAFYASPGSDSQAQSDRKKYFEIATAAFEKALQKNPSDFKARYSLARCLFRDAIQRPEDQQDRLLSRADDALGDAPQAEVDFQTHLKSEVVEWYVWKMKVDSERRNTAGLLGLAEAASPFVQDESLAIELRSSLARECSVGFGLNRRWDKAVQCLQILDDQGPIEEVLARLGTLSDIGWRNLSSDPDVFTNVLRTLDQTVRRGTKVGDDESAYNLAETASRALRELVVGVATGRDGRQTQCLTVDLSRGVRAYAEIIDPQSGGDYAILAGHFSEGEVAARERTAKMMFLFAADLAAFLETQPEIRDYVQQNCYLIVFYALLYWENQVLQSDGDAQPDKVQQMLAIKQEWGEQLTAERSSGLLFCLQRFQSVVDREGESGLQQRVAGAIALVNALSPR